MAAKRKLSAAKETNKKAALQVGDLRIISCPLGNDNKDFNPDRYDFVATMDVGVWFESIRHPDKSTSGMLQQCAYADMDYDAIEGILDKFAREKVTVPNSMIKGFYLTDMPETNLADSNVRQDDQRVHIVITDYMAKDEPKFFFTDVPPKVSFEFSD